MALQPVVHDVRQRVLAREIEVEGFRASGRAEDGAHTAAPYKAAAPDASGQGALRILSAAHVAARDAAGGRLACLRSRLRSALVPSPCSTWQARRCGLASVSKH